MTRIKVSVVAAFLLSIAAAGAQTLPDIQPVPAFDPATQIVKPLSAEAECTCTMEYNPVCGRTSDGTRKTFSNECLAMCEKVEIASLGPC